jgi:ABC-type phosphonate transport system ATPase subunit
LNVTRALRPSAESRQRAAELLEKFDLAEAAGKSLATYSGGMRCRLDLAMTLVGKPRLSPYTLSDTRTLLHRNLVPALRYPAMSLSTLLMPLA